MRRHESYKSSGEKWLGDVPSHWEILPFKALFTMSNEKNDKDIIGEMLSVSGYRGIEVKQYEFEEQKRTDKELKDYRVVRPGQLVVNTMWLNYAGLGVSSHEGYVSPAYRSYWLDSRLRPQYAHYLLRSHPYIQGYTGQMQGIRPNSLQIKNSDFNKIPVLIPPHSEQDRIVNFLDQKTAEIDAAIAKKQRLIELLQEQKSILINQAVTLGLNPNVAMRDSGIEWIGEVPAHWEIAANRRFIKKIVQGSSPAIDNLNDESGFAVAKISVVKAGQYIDGEVKPIPRKLYRMEYQIRAGDFLLTRGNTPELVADVCYVENSPSSPVMLSDLIYRLTFNAEKVDGRYMRYFFQCPIIRNQVRINARGSSSTMVKVSQEHIKSWIVICPPIYEQVAIANYLSELESKINEVIRMTTNQIDKLVEFRVGVVSMAVTGFYRI
ncbi:restriction endonuclease subunit S [Methylomonas sp. LL1]|uniref:restriction endonuclease subunit S n=1 Tax=Methylomonas sp. LL1 TaxID=2785785 RepID=UPI0018C3A44C|nr:restriction endonuclease subunit S [Methylomonas sp. LL1]QPK62548.1 restriction endonuclease subunit S [Methylomonas sp. LL1]